MYTLDFRTVLQVMQEHQKTGLLYADVPPDAVGMREPCRIEVKLEAGTMVSCSIVTESGQRLSEKESVRKISRLGALVWTFVPLAVAAQPAQPAQPAQSLALVPEHASVPWRTLQVDQWQMRSWPRLHRAIFALADGTRSIAKIAAMLSVPPELVTQAVHDLRAIGVIVIGPPQDGKYQP
jgi:hypothetical protein